ncbi:MAG: DUF481 domain-containing protein [Porticoccaceae bacterium]|nr:DUF481 domain-containing protein [Porticoccaceae bacterium]
MNRTALFRIVLLASLTAMPGMSLASEDAWHFGIGTGIFALNVEGDSGFNTLAGPVESEFDADFDDILDLADTAVGITGFAQKGKWTIDYAFSILEVSGDNSGVISATGVPFRSSVSFDATAALVGLGYQLIKNDRHNLQARAGLRYTNHDIEFKITAGPANVAKNIDEDWVDGYVGLTYQMRLAPNWYWTTKADVGAGGSDLSTTINTGVAWHFTDAWVTSLYGNYYSVDFENGSKGDSDWYEYDADEFGVGLGITYLW